MKISDDFFEAGMKIVGLWFALLSAIAATVILIAIIILICSKVAKAGETLPQLATRLHTHSVFKIHGENTEHEWSGTAFLVKDWLGITQLVSNAHVCTPPTAVFTLEDNRVVVPVQLDYEHDLCRLTVDIGRLDVPLTVAVSASRQHGALFTYAGYPKGGDIQAYQGLFLGTEIASEQWWPRWTIQYEHLTHCDPYASSADTCVVLRLCDDYSFVAIGGVSGSPVFDQNNAVTGVIWGSDQQGQAHAITLKYLRSFLGFYTGDLK